MENDSLDLKSPSELVLPLRNSIFLVDFNSPDKPAVCPTVSKS